MDPKEPLSYNLTGSIKGWILIGLFCFPTLLALVQIARAVLFGVIYTFTRSRGQDLIFQWSDPNSIGWLIFYIFIGSFVPGGILVGMWATRNDKY
jgi:hypothetical protein